MNETDAYPWTRLSTDPNGDGTFSVSDLSTWLLDLFLLPGDTLLYALLNYLPGAADFLELGGSDYGGPFAIGLSVIAWLIALLAAGTLLTMIRDFDRRLTAVLAGHLDNSRRLLRVLRRRLAVGFRSVLSARGRGGDGVRVEPLILERLERAVLRSLTNIDDGSVLTVEELAVQLNRPAGEIRSIHNRLRELKLIEHGQDSYAKRNGLRITTAGQIVLLGN